jgi:glycosyltransferase involved in cell wall biosynthesis
MPLSVAIIAKDEEDRIANCLESVSFADEVLVVDSGSRDSTINIAKSFGCRVLFQEWLGYALQKQYAVNQCRNDWVLIMDADERVPPGTAKRLEELISSNRQVYSAYSLLRKNFFRQRWIRHCGWWPERVVRVVNRKKGQFSDNLVHEKWIAEGTIKELDIYIEHYSFRNYSDIIDKMQKYSTLAAEEMIKNQKAVGWWTPLTHGLWMFIRTYFLEKGILEGFDGFVISALNAGGSFMKYAKLREARIYGQLEQG